MLVGVKHAEQRCGTLGTSKWVVAQQRWLGHVFALQVILFSGSTGSLVCIFSLAFSPRLLRTTLRLTTAYVYDLRLTAHGYDLTTRWLCCTM
jgi:hypothetical protein